MKLPLFAVLSMTYLLSQALAQETPPPQAQKNPPEDARLPLIKAAEAADARAAVTPLPIPAKLPLITRSSSYGEWHAFSAELPTGPVLVMANNLLGAGHPNFNGSPLKLGPLVKYHSGGFCELWVWKLARGPATAGAPVLRSANLPLLREEDELVIVTQSGHRIATIDKDWFHNTELLPGEPSPKRTLVLIGQNDSSGMMCGDPVFHKRTGELIGAVCNVPPESVRITPRKAEIIFLNFSPPPQVASPPLTHLWGIPVKPSAMDREIFARVIPRHVTQDRMGEDIASVWARNPYLGRRPHSAISTPTGANEELHDGFQMETRSVGITKGKVSELSYFCWRSFQKREAELLVRWLVEKFSEPQIYELPKSNLLLAAWGDPNCTITLRFDFSDGRANIQLFVRPVDIAEIGRNNSPMRQKAGGSSLILQWIASVPDPPKEDPFVERR